ncbi:MAG TPA: hypothetical protein VMG35_15100 [Bryobacteraceae bacterium]|nr:hypothetical protein [Bryobacteraceae bacterium]
MRLVLVCLIAVLACAAMWAAGNPALGKWNCSSVGENGTKLDWSLEVTENAGQLAATATLDGTDMPLLDPKVEGDTLTFKLRVNDHEVVSFELHIDGDKLTGRFEGTESGKATISGTRSQTR